MKFNFTAIISAVLAALLLSSSAIAADTTLPETTEDGYRHRLPDRIKDKIKDHVPTAAGNAFNWYCRHKKNGEIPDCPPEMSFITDCGGVYLGSPEDKVIYLTFDAGYENGNITRILDTMKEKDVTGAFFVLENIVRQNTDLIRRTSNEGHLICNHTAKHKDMSKITDESAFKAELDSLNDCCRDAGVTCAPFYRPPEGRFSRTNLENAQNLGYTTVFWSFAYADWDNNAQPSPEAAKQKILDGTHNGMILLLHPTSSTNAEILGDLIDSWKEMGYRFGSLEELATK